MDMNLKKDAIVLDVMVLLSKVMVRVAAPVVWETLPVVIVLKIGHIVRSVIGV